MIQGIWSSIQANPYSESLNYKLLNYVKGLVCLNLFQPTPITTGTDFITLAPRQPNSFNQFVALQLLQILHYTLKLQGFQGNSASGPSPIT